MRLLRTCLDHCGQRIRELRSGRADLDRSRRRYWRRDDGMNTAEYAVGTLAAVAFAGILLKVLTSDAVRAALSSIVQRALQ